MTTRTSAIMNNKQQMLLHLVLLGLITYGLWLFQFSFWINVTIFAILMILAILKGTFKQQLLVLLFSILASSRTHDTTLLELTNNIIYTVDPHIVTVSILSIVSIVKAVKNRKMHMGKLSLPILLISIYALISIIWTPVFIDGLSGFFTILEGYMMYFIISEHKDEELSMKDISIVFTVFGFVLSAQMLTHYINYGFIEALKTKHVFSDFWANPNVAFALYGFIIPMSLYKYRHIKSKYKYLFIVLDLMIIGCMILSQSRGLYFGFIVGIIFALLIYFRSRSKTLLVIGGTIFVSFIATMMILVFFKERFISSYEWMDEFSNGRLALYDIAIHRFTGSLRTFIFGDGILSSRYYIELAGKSSMYYHSFFFYAFATLGIIGIALYSFLFYRIYQVFKPRLRKYAYLSIAILVFLAHQLVDVGFDNRFLGVIFYFIVGLVEYRQLNLEKQLQESK